MLTTHSPQCVGDHCQEYELFAVFHDVGLGRWLSRQSACHPSMRTWIRVPSTHKSLKGAASPFNPRRTLGTRWSDRWAQSVSSRFSNRVCSKDWGGRKTPDTNLWPPDVHTDLTHKCTYTPTCMCPHRCRSVCPSMYWHVFSMLVFSMLVLWALKDFPTISCFWKILSASTDSGLLDYCSYFFLIMPGNFLFYARHCG